MSATSGRLLGVILAGGSSRRFGRDKATAELAGEPMARRIGRTVEPRVKAVGVVANDAGVGRRLPWPTRSDLRPGLGPAGGIHTALAWAREVGAPGALVVACDLPLVPGSLLGLLADQFRGDRPVAPASPGPLGFQPLCAVYPTLSLETVNDRLADGPVPAHALLKDLQPIIVSPEEVAGVCDPRVAFLNVNRVEDRERAEALLSG